MREKGVKVSGRGKKTPTVKLLRLQRNEHLKLLKSLGIFETYYHTFKKLQFQKTFIFDKFN